MSSWKPQCDTVSHAVYLFVHTSLPAKHSFQSHWSGVRPLVSTTRMMLPPPPLELFLGIPLLPCAVEILQIWVCGSGSFRCLSVQRAEQGSPLKVVSSKRNMTNF